MTVEIIQERLNKIMGLSLKQGSHQPDSEYCFMEAVAFVAGEEWSDDPEQLQQSALELVKRMLAA